MQFDDEELTEEKIENKTKQTLKVLDKIAGLYDQALKQAAKLENTPKSKKRSYLHARYAVSRTRIEMSQLARSIEFNPFERKRLIDKMRHTVERLQSLEREAGKLERRADVSKGDTAAEARRELRTRRTRTARDFRRQRSRAHRTEAHAAGHPARRERKPSRPRRN